MKKFLLVLCLLLLAAIAYLFVSGQKTQTVKTEIDIAAPPEKVWAILTDINKWHEWSPTINASQGEGAVGSELSITMMSKEAGKDGPKYNPTIIQMDEPAYFHWRAHMLASIVFTNEKIVELKKTETGTKVTHTETFKGMMAALMRGNMEEGVTPMLTMMNEALKQTAEQ